MLPCYKYHEDVYYKMTHAAVIFFFFFFLIKAGLWWLGAIHAIGLIFQSFLNNKMHCDNVKNY